METKSKNLRIESNFEKEVSVLCELLHTNFSNKTRELLFKWKLEEEKKLKKYNPELYQKYVKAIIGENKNE